MAASDPDEGVAINAPVPRHDLRAPAAVLLGVAGVAALAWFTRRRRSSAAAPASAQEPVPAHTRSAIPAALLGSAIVVGGALVSRRIGVVRMIRYAPLLRAGIAWLAHPQPLLPGRGGVGVRPADLARLGFAMAGGDRRKQALAIAALLLGAVAAPLAAGGAAPRASDRRTKTDSDAATIDGARRQLHVAAALLGIAVLLDSGLEHYRACFENPAMYTPLVASSLTILVNVHACVAGEVAPGLRDAVHLTTGVVGIVGLGFHFYNIGKRPGGYSWLNFFYGAPFGAPAALTLAALIGVAAERLDADRPAAQQHVIGLPFGRAMAALVAAGLVGTVAEVGLLHFRGAFHNPFMWLPVSLPPVAAMLMAKQALVSDDGFGDDAWITRGWLWATVVLGIGGMGFHAYGVSRNMGGWYNWSQNILAGPPLPAPPSFSALALAGLAALDLIEASR